MPLYEGVSYGGEKTPVVFDIGMAYTKCGFAGENSPRCIIPSQVKRVKTGQIIKICSCTTDPEELYGILVDFIHILFFRHLLVNPKDRRVVVVESVLTPTSFRCALAKALFKHFEVPSVLFAPSHLMVLFTLGSQSGLVMDSGYEETLVLPIFEGIPIIKALEAIPLGGKAIHNYLEAQLKELGTVKTEDRSEKPLSAVYGTLEETTTEDIKVRCCFVTKLERAKKLQAVSQGKAEASEAPEPPPSVEYPLGGSAVLNIQGKTRESACEILFEQDNEEKSVASLLLDALLQCPIDMRKQLAENVVVMGGTAMLPGFKHRLSAELQDLLQKPKYQTLTGIKTFKFHPLVAKENYAAWLGGAIFGALETLASRSVPREIYQQTGKIPDWCSLPDPEEKEEKVVAVKR